VTGDLKLASRDRSPRTQADSISSGRPAAPAIAVVASRISSLAAIPTKVVRARPHAVPAVPTKLDRPKPDRREWEMVLPRMAPRPSRGVQAPQPDPEPPAFESASESKAARLWNRMPLGARIAAVAVAVFGIGFSAWHAVAASEAAAMRSAGGPEIAMGQVGWVNDWASDPAGSKRARQITLYSPSLNLSDYKMEFRGRIIKNSLGWVFRAKNSKNYYVAKLEVMRPGPFPAVALTRFAVVDGIEGPHTQKMLPIMVRNDTSFHVRLDAAGPKFSISVQDQVVDFWADDKLKSGGVGFITERDEDGKIDSIQISFAPGSRERS
jgi:hypothetical protein